MTCRRCGQQAPALKAITVPVMGEVPLCDICMDIFWAWIGMLRPEPYEVPAPPFSLYYEE